MRRRETKPQTLGERLDDVVAGAVRDYRRGRDHRARIVNGIVGRAHGWCCDFHGTKEELAAAGLADPSWFKDARAKVCKVFDFGGREIEVFRLCGSSYELSIHYNDAERERIRA